MKKQYFGDINDYRTYGVLRRVPGQQHGSAGTLPAGSGGSSAALDLAHESKGV
jgi:hypothetical protein